MSEIVLSDKCLIWGCDKTWRNVPGKHRGRRGMCWTHYREAQREGDLVPWDRRRLSLASKRRCAVCGESALWMRDGRPLCHSHYHADWRQTTPTREARMQRDRDRKRGWRQRAREKELAAAA